MLSGSGRQIRPPFTARFIAASLDTTPRDAGCRSMVLRGLVPVYIRELYHGSMPLTYKNPGGKSGKRLSSYLCRSLHAGSQRHLPSYSMLSGSGRQIRPPFTARFIAASLDTTPRDAGCRSMVLRGLVPVYIRELYHGSMPLTYKNPGGKSGKRLSSYLCRSLHAGSQRHLPSYSMLSGSGRQIRPPFTAQFHCRITRYYTKRCRLPVHGVKRVSPRIYP